MTDKTELSAQRGIIKRGLTNFTKHVEGLEGHVELGNLLSLKQRIELNLRITNVKSLYDSFQDIQQKIEILASESEADTEKEQAYRDTFESNYYSVLAKAQCLIHEEDKKASGSSGLSGAGQTPSVKLPIISLPEFDGSVDHWLEYRDTFQSLVHKCPSVSKIQKFHYLKSTLKGSAQLVIDSIEFCEDNYDTAWELLLNRYDNSKLLVQKHVKSLFTMPSITKESSPQIRKLIDVTLKNIRALKLLGESTEHWDTLIIYMIVSKLDQSTEREWEQHKCSLSVTDDSKIIKLDDLVKFLRQKADMLDTLSHSVSHKTNNTQNTQNKPSNSVAQKVHCHIATEKSGTNTNTKNNQTRKRLCVLCSAPHPLYSCQKFLDLSIQDRIQIVRKHRLCENCMNSPTHTATDCKYGPCRKCETKKHNSLICDHANASQVNKATVRLQSAAEAREATVPSDNSSNSSHSRASAQSQSYSVQVKDETHMNTNTQSTFMEPSLLSTALVEVSDKDGNFHQVRAVLDNCSEKCLVTQSLCDKLGLQLVQSTIQIRGVDHNAMKTTNEKPQFADIFVRMR
ncbi:hypothetical protein NE865_09421 [Phthorimaea operculella]|nr:hypothetical protein NE865_09421 [Phthorimaea operculella]